jgi:predicted RNase H-like HicB family nuclease
MRKKLKKLTGGGEEVGFIPVESQKKTYLFEVVIEPDNFPDGREAWMAYCPALKGCTTWGYTYPETLKNIRDAIEVYSEEMIAHGEAIPAKWVAVTANH